MSDDLITLLIYGLSLSRKRYITLGAKSTRFVSLLRGLGSHRSAPDGSGGLSLYISIKSRFGTF